MLRRPKSEPTPWDGEPVTFKVDEFAPAFAKGIKASELMALEFPPIRYVVPGYIAEGLTLLAGAPKVCKSWMCLDIAIAVANGGLAFGSIPCGQGDVLVLALEDNLRRLQDRLRKMGVTSPPDRLTFCTEWPTGNDAAKQIDEWARSVDHPTLVIVDVLARVRECTGGERSYQADYEALEPLHDLATRRSLAIVVVHHTRKMPADDPSDEVSGTRGLTANVDTTLVIRRDNTGGPSFRATLYGRGRDIPLFEAAIEFDEEFCRWSVLGEAWQIAATAERQELLDILNGADGPMRLAQIAEAVGKSAANVGKMLGKMIDDGQVIKPRVGLYSPVKAVNVVEDDRSTSTISTTLTSVQQPFHGEPCGMCGGDCAAFCKHEALR